MPDVLFVHAGPPEHGVHRFSRLLADAVAQQVPVAELVLPGGPRGPRLTALWSSRAALRGAPVIHLQHQATLWGPGAAGVAKLVVLRLLRGGGRTITTFHDVYPLPRMRRRSWLRHPRRSWRRATARVSRRVATHLSDVLVVSSAGESAWLTDETGRSAVVVPHVLVPAADARQRRPTSGSALRLGVLGYIHPRKGYELVVRALPHLPAATAVFIGRPTSPAFLDRLLRDAVELGVAGRIEHTGYVADAALPDLLTGIDIALCPYRDISASSSLSDWLSHGVPVVASDVGFVRELAEREPGAIEVLDGYDEAALVAAVRRVRQRLEDDGERARLADAIESLKAGLAPEVVASQLVALYRG